MYCHGQKLILRLNPEGVYLSGDEYVSRRSVQVGAEPAKSYSPHPDIFWMGARVGVPVEYGSNILINRQGMHQGA